MPSLSGRSMCRPTLAMSGGPAAVLMALALVLLSVLPQASEATSQKTCPLGVVLERKGACGSELSSMLSFMCRSQYHGIMKRGHKGTEPTGPVGGPSSVFLAKTEADSMLGHREKRKQSIVCECCYHRCTISELMQYCSGPSAHSFLNKRSGDEPVMAPAISSRLWQHVHPAGTPSAPRKAPSTLAKEIRDLKEKQAIGREIMLYGASWFDDDNDLDLDTKGDAATMEFMGREEDMDRDTSQGTSQDERQLFTD